MQSNIIASCPFCNGAGEIVKDIDIDLIDLFPSGRAVRCISGCWIDGVLIDYDDWQNKEQKQEKAAEQGGQVDAMVMPDDTPCQATDPKELERQIMSVNIPKNEREWWAKRRIEELQDFCIWMTGCGYDFAQHKYFCQQRDKLLKV